MGGGARSVRRGFTVRVLFHVTDVCYSWRRLCYSLSVIAALRVFGRLEIWLPSFHVCHRPSLSVWPPIQSVNLSPTCLATTLSIFFLSFTRLWKQKSAARKSIACVHKPLSAAIYDGEPLSSLQHYQWSTIRRFLLCGFSAISWMKSLPSGALARHRGSILFSGCSSRRKKVLNGLYFSQFDPPKLHIS